MYYLDICDFGAKGDGRSDDTQALLAAMARAEKESGVVYFPPGHYCIHPVIVPSNITLMGHSAWALCNRDETGNVLVNEKLKDYSNLNISSSMGLRFVDEIGGLAPNYQGRVILSPLSGNARALLDLEGKTGTRIAGLTLDGNYMGNRMHGIYVSNLGVENNVVIEDCRIESFTGSGIRLDFTWVSAVRRCIISGCLEHGIDMSRSYDIWIMDNEIGAQGAAIYAVSDTYSGDLPEPKFAQGQKPEIGADPSRIASWGCAATTITACRLEWSKLGGIVLYDSESVQINGCSMDHNFGPGVMLMNCKAMTVTGCLMRSNGADRLDDMSCHLRVEGCKGVSATGNALYGAFGRSEHPFIAPTPFYGMVARNLEACIITANSMFQSASKQGILDYGGHKDSFIDNNTYTKPDLTGIKYSSEKIVQENG